MLSLIRLPAVPAIMSPRKTGERMLPVRPMGQYGSTVQRFDVVSSCSVHLRRQRSTMARFAHWRRSVLGAVSVGAALALAAVNTPAASAQDGHGSHARKVGHVWTIIFENKSYESTFTGLNQNSYLWKTLPRYGELLRQYYGTGHYSLDNYISLVSGQAPAPDLQADCPQYTNVAPGYPAADGQVYAGSGCV